MFERFTERARHVVVLAQEEARALKHNHIGTEHLLLGLFGEPDAVAGRILREVGIDATDVRQAVTAIVPAGTIEPTKRRIPFTPRAKKVLELALREALGLKHNYIGTEHVLLGTIREAEGVGARVLVSLGLTYDEARNRVIEILGGQPGTPRVAPHVLSPLSSRFSPGVTRAMEIAGDLAGRQTIGTQHILAAFAQAPELVAYSILRAGGFQLDVLPSPPERWDVAGTADDTPEQAAARATTVEVEESGVVARLADPATAQRLSEAISSGDVDPEQLRAIFGEVFRKIEELGRRHTEPEESDEGEDDVP